MAFDIVACVGPNEKDLVDIFVKQVKDNIRNFNKVFLIVPAEIIEVYKNKEYTNVEFVDERTFPFQKSDIDTMLKCPKRSGWYLQQLLKLYAAVVLPNLLDNFVIIDSDIYFHKNVDFFEDNKIVFNTGTEHHIPYFEHMQKLHTSLRKFHSRSGICHYMPMKKHIVHSLLKMIEDEHHKFFWIVFIEAVDPKHAEFSGASEYEMLFNYTITRFPDEYKINNIPFRNTGYPDLNYDGYYEAIHWYLR